MSTDIPAVVLPENAGSTLLPENAGSILLPLARAAIATHLGARAGLHAEHEWLRSTRASFVTLTMSGKLRGCIGTLEAHRELAADVTANAVAAAFKDPRFQPLTQSEFGAVSVEVSVLSPLEAIVFRDEDEALQQLRPNIHGVVLQYGHHRSTFLPQVWEEISDPHLFLGNLKYKAGLPQDFWDPAVKLSRYTVSKWREGATG